MAEEGPQIKAIEGVSGGWLVAVCLGGAMLALCVGAAACVCYRRRRRRLAGKRHGHGPDQPLAFHTHRRPTAVKSPAGNAAGAGPTGGPHYLKKSPSPTGPSKTPPGMSAPHTPSPTGSSGGGGGGGGGSGGGGGGGVGPLEGGVHKGECGGGTGNSTGCNAGGGHQTQMMDNKDQQQQQQQQQQPQQVMAGKTDVYTTENETHTPTKEEMETNEKNLQQSASYLGQLVFKLRYKQDKNALVVSVVRCRDLPAKDEGQGQGGGGGGSSDPYVKLQLLPDKQHKVKTRVLRKTRHPVYDEDFTFYGIGLNQLPAITLHFVVLSFDRYSRDDIIGEVFCALDTVDLAQIETQQMALCREIQPRSLKIRSQGRGELLVSLCWQPAATRLTVVVLKARNLPKMDVTGLADPYVKIYLLYNGQRVAKKKTHVKKRTLSPVFNESFVFDVPPAAVAAATAAGGGAGDGLENVSLEFLLLDWDRVTKNEVIGRLELGGPKCTGTALHHWNEVCNSPRRQIADWHKLRE